MADLSIADWMAAKSAPAELIAWAVNSATMADVWVDCPSVWCRWIATREGPLPEQYRRYFAGWAADQVSALGLSAASTAVNMAFAYADGYASAADMAMARRDALMTARSATGSLGIATVAAGMACGVDAEFSLNAAIAAVEAARMHAVEAAIADAVDAGGSVSPADYASVGDDAAEAALDAQAVLLREAFTPSFES